MLYLVVALHCEAKPLIEHFGLTRDFTLHSHELFVSDDVSLIISGIGTIPSAIATTLILSKIGSSKDSVCANIGICGSGKETKGSLFLVNRSLDVSTGSTHYPDLLIKSPIREASISTFPSPVTSPHLGSDLVDMEASGFFEAALKFLPPSQVLSLKVVSDSCAGERLSKDEVSDLISSNVPAISELLRRYKVATHQSPTFFTEEEELVIAQCVEKLKLTSSQERMLSEWAKAFKIRNKDESSKTLTKISEMTPSQIGSKLDAKRALETVRGYLTAL